MRKLTSIESSHTQPHTAFQVVGRSHKHESAEKQVSGEAQFLDDYATPRGCLHAAVVTSAIAKGQVSSVDLSAVSQADGVVRVLTADDIPGEKDIGTIFKGDPLLMLNGEIRYFGQPIVLVLATSHELAWKAARLANVEYAKSDNVTLSYAEASLKEPLLARHQMGPNPDTALFDQADIHLDGDLHVGGQEHFYLEGQASLAELTEDGGIFLRSSTQNPSEVQKLVAEVLAVDFNRVTVDMRRMGGGFGGKESQAAQWACMAALGAFHTKRAVKMRLPRAVDMTATGKRHPFYNRYQLAADQQGVIQAASIEVNGICGHSPDLSDAIVDRAMFHADNAYSLGKATVVGNRLKTDMVSHTAFRGFGGPQGMIVIEKAMQELALATGLDALDVRLNNLYRAGKNITPYGMEVEQYDEMRGIIEQLEADADYRARRLEIEQWNMRIRC